jgi:hypothetical protein
VSGANKVHRALWAAHDTLEMVRGDERTKDAGLWQGEMIPRVLRMIREAIETADPDRPDDGTPPPPPRP